MMEINHTKKFVKLHREIISNLTPPLKNPKKPASPFPSRKMIYCRYKDILQRSNSFCLLKNPIFFFFYGMNKYIQR